MSNYYRPYDFQMDTDRFLTSISHVVVVELPILAVSKTIQRSSRLDLFNQVFSLALGPVLLFSVLLGASLKTPVFCFRCACGFGRTHKAWDSVILSITRRTTMAITSGSNASIALRAVVCLACLACSTVVGFVGPMSAARASLTTRVNTYSAASTTSTSALRPLTASEFVSRSEVLSSRVRAATLPLHSSNSQSPSMAMGGGKKTAIITGASSGKQQCRLQSADSHDEN